jgi:hypothetical protein
MRLSYLRLLFIPLLLLGASCSGSDPKPAASGGSGGPSKEARALAADDQEAAIIDAILINLHGFEQEDVDLAMAALDPDSPIYDSSEEITRKLFKMYDLEYELSDIVVTSKTETRATVHYVQVTRKVSGPEFRDNRIEGEHLLRKKDGKWLIYDSRPDKIDYLN